MKNPGTWVVAAVVFTLGVASVDAQTIVSFSPLSANAGATVTITGTGFSSTAANNIVRFGQGTGTVTTASGTSLSVTVPASATYGFITVTVPGNLATAYSSLPFDPQHTSGDIDSSYASVSGTISLGGSPWMPTLVDMNGDGKLDLLVSRSSASTIAYLQNTSSSGTISFATPSELSVSTPATKIVPADLDGDGKQDLILVSRGYVTLYHDIGTPGSPNLQVWQTFNNPDMTGGSWQIQRAQVTTGQSIKALFLLAGGSAPSSFPDNSVVWVPNYITNMAAQDVVVADFNGDGLPDIAIAYSGDPSVNINGRVRIYTNTYNVLFHTRSFVLTYDAEIHQPVFDNELDVYSIAAGDFNRDGRTDLVVAGNFDAFHSSGMVTVLMNVDGTNFTPAENWQENARIQRVVVGDFDGDSLLDIAYQSVDDVSIRIRRNTTPADTTVSFDNSLTVSNTFSENSLQLADYDGDGKPDLVWAQQSGGNRFRVARNTSTSGSISFASSIPYAVSGFDFPGYIAVGDLDGDGKPDIVGIKQLSDQMVVLQNAVPSYSVAHSLISVTTPTISKNGSTPVSLQIKDAVGNNLGTTGLTVTFGLTGSGTSSGTFGATGDGGGVYSAVLTGTNVGTANGVTATINGKSVTSALPTVTVAAGSVSIPNSTIVISRSQLTAGANATVYLQARDANGDSLTTGGLTGITFFLAGSGTSSGSFGTVSDSSNGKYYATFTASTSGTARSICARRSTDTVKTTLPTFTVSAGKYSLGSSLLTISSTTMHVYDTLTVTLQVKDSSNNNVTTGGLNVEIQIFGSVNPINNGKAYLTSVVDNQNGTYTSKLIGIGTGTGTAVTALIYNASPSYQTYQTLTYNPAPPPSPVSVTARPFSLTNSYVMLSQSTTTIGGQVYFYVVANDDMNQPYTQQDITVALNLANDGTMNGSPLGMLLYSGSGLYSYTWQASAVGTARTAIGTVNGDTLVVKPTLAVLPYGTGLYYPGYSATAVPTDTIISWAPSSGATSYRVQIVADSATGSVVIDSSGITGTQLAISGLWNYRTYVARVAIFLNSIQGSYSSDYSFRTVVAPAELTSPTTRATGVSTTAAFSWVSANGATSYRFQLATDSLFTGLIEDTSGLAATADTAGVLSSSTRYFWRVTASGDGGTSSWSETRSFTTTAPLAVQLSSLEGVSDRLNADLRWKTATETNNYGFQVERRYLGPLSAVPPQSPSATASATWDSAGFVRGAGTTAAPHSYGFIDRNIPAAWYSYRLKSIDRSGSAGYSQTVNVGVGTAPKVFSLSQNYPNPFNPTTTIEFTVPDDGRTRLVIYNMLGQEVETLLDESLKAGEFHQVRFNGARLASGIYFSVLRFGNKQLVKKMLLLK